MKIRFREKCGAMRVKTEPLRRKLLNCTSANIRTGTDGGMKSLGRRRLRQEVDLLEQVGRKPSDVLRFGPC